MFSHTCKNCYKTQTGTPIALTFGTQKGSPKVNPSLGGGKGGSKGLKPPLRMISHRNYLSWSGTENRDKDKDTLIEQSL